MGKRRNPESVKCREIGGGRQAILGSRDPASCGSSSELSALGTAEMKDGHLNEVIMVTP